MQSRSKRGDRRRAMSTWARCSRAAACGRVVVVRNVTEPTFESASGMRGCGARRHVRVGVAWGDRWPGLPRTIVAFDADVTRVRTPSRRAARRRGGRSSGGSRDSASGFAAGIRAEHGGRRAAGRRPAAARTRCASALTWTAYVAGGRTTDRAWGIGARVTY